MFIEMITDIMASAMQTDSHVELQVYHGNSVHSPLHYQQPLVHGAHNSGEHNPWLEFWIIRISNIVTFSSDVE